MIRIGRFIPACALFAALALPHGASAQIFSTFKQPGDLYNSVEASIYYIGGTGNFLASSFGYAGATGVQLGSVRFAGQDLYQSAPLSPLTVTFRTGATMGTSSILETWTIPDNALPDHIYTLASVLNPSFVNGNTYWLELSVIGYQWGWNYNNKAPLALGTATSTDAGATWTNNPLSTAPAFEINALGGSLESVVTPEPATMTLMATGLLFMGGAVRRKRKR
jgi:hypothetical protein